MGRVGQSTGRRASCERRARIAAGLREVWHELAGLVLPVQCAGCGRDDEAWCPPCRAAFDREPWRCEQRAGRLDPLDAAPLPVLTLADCVGAVRAAVIAWKDRGRRDLTRPLVACASRLGSALVVGPPGVASLAALAPGTSVLVVPAPSTRAALRRRGFAHVDELADGVVDGLRSTGLVAHRARVLLRDGADQVGLGVRDRARLGRVRVASRHGAAVHGRLVVLVDDVLTSGATLAAAARALTSAGALPVAAVTLASTPGPGALNG